MQPRAMQGAQARRAETPTEWMAAKCQESRSWLDGRSEFFTHMAGYTVSRRLAIKANTALALFIGAAVAANGSLLLAAAMATGLVWIILPKKGGAR